MNDWQKKRPLDLETKMNTKDGWVLRADPVSAKLQGQITFLCSMCNDSPRLLSQDLQSQLKVLRVHSDI
uniref:Uncharacterized protein n=1 Tax=Coturnix japonica TaxID=93934 RepID=A0A8C2Y5Q7_COTJA